jgi:hypothetical protein
MKTYWEWRYTPYLLTYLLTPWCRILFEKLIVTQLVKNILLSYGTRRFITVFTKASWIQFAPSIPISLRSILTLSSHLRLGPTTGLLPSDLPTKGGIAPRFLTLALDGCKWSVSRPGRFTFGEGTPSTRWKGGWVVPRAGLDAVARRKKITALPGNRTRSSNLCPQQKTVEYFYKAFCRK